MTPLPVAESIAHGGDADDMIALAYDARMLRRKRLVAASGLAFLVDLPQAMSLVQGDVFVLQDGRRVRVDAADEPLLEVRGDLPRLAWHIGNRHAPCEVLPDCLRIQSEKVMRQMLEQLGADVTELQGPFNPEGGAYGEGRTMGHDHSHSHAH